MKRLRLIINFKNTDEDIKLYNEIKKHSSISGFVKDAVKRYLKETA